MKIVSLGALIVGVVLSLTAKAALSQADCVSTRNSAHEFTAFIVNQELKAIRIQSNSSLPQQIPVNLVSNQPDSNTSIYTLVGAGGLVIVDKQVLNNQPGHIEISGEVFNCSPL